MVHETPISVRIIEEIAMREDANPTALEPPLQTVIDVDALDTVIRSAADGPCISDVSVEFTYRGYQVCVDAETVDVTESPSNGTSSGTPEQFHSPSQ